MNLKSILEIKVSEEETVNNSSSYRYIAEMLDFLKIPFSSSVRDDAPRVYPKPLDTSYYLVFRLNREITHPECIHYLSEIIQGRAGLLCVLSSECYSYSYKLIIDN